MMRTGRRRSLFWNKQFGKANVRMHPHGKISVTKSY